VDTCLIWGTEAKDVNHQGVDGSGAISSRAGGEYFLSGTAGAMISSKDDPFRARLTTWIIDQRRLGLECPEVTSYTLSDIEQRPALSVHVRAERLLEHLQSRMTNIGDVIEVPASGNDEAMLAVTESLKMSEVTYLLDFLETSQYIEKEQHQTMS
jgi:hypothetical protein